MSQSKKRRLPNDLDNDRRVSLVEWRWVRQLRALDPTARRALLGLLRELARRAAKTGEAPVKTAEELDALFDAGADMTPYMDDTQVRRPRRGVQ